MKKIGLHERQSKSIKHIDKYGKITRVEYEKLLFVSPRTASRELQELCKKGLIKKKGKGPVVHYVMASYGELKRNMNHAYNFHNDETVFF